MSLNKQYSLVIPQFYSQLFSQRTEVRLEWSPNVSKKASFLTKFIVAQKRIALQGTRERFITVNEAPPSLAARITSLHHEHTISSFQAFQFALLECCFFSRFLHVSLDYSHLFATRDIVRFGTHPIQFAHPSESGCFLPSWLR